MSMFKMNIIDYTRTSSSIKLIFFENIQLIQVRLFFVYESIDIVYILLEVKRPSGFKSI